MRTPIERVRALVTDFPEISSAVLFGSRGRGTERPDSDLDLAILPSTPSSEARRRLQNRVAAALSDLSPAGRVDVVLLDEAPELLRQRIFEDGTLLFCRDQRAWKDLRVRTMREHGDREWARELFARAQRKRLLEGRSDGRSPRALGTLGRP